MKTNSAHLVQIACNDNSIYASPDAFEDISSICSFLLNAPLSNILLKIIE